MAIAAASGTRWKNRAISQPAGIGAFGWFRSATRVALGSLVCAAATNQKFGNKNIASAPTATVTAAMTINARFHRVQSIKAPKGPRAATVAMPAIIMTTPIDLAGIPMAARQQINREEGP